MKRRRAASFALALACCARALAADPATAPVAPAPRAVPSAETIRAAVRATLAERPAIPRPHAADTLRATRYDAFARQAEEATVPDCLHAEGLKRQPTFFLGGLLALPFVPIAWLRGKCQ